MTRMIEVEVSKQCDKNHQRYDRTRAVNKWIEIVVGQRYDWKNQCKWARVETKMIKVRVSGKIRVTGQ